MLKRYRCQCGNAVFFRNSVCLVCSTPLGFDTALRLLIPLEKSTVYPDTSDIGLWQEYGKTGAIYAQSASKSGSDSASNLNTAPGTEVASDQNKIVSENSAPSLDDSIDANVNFDAAAPEIPTAQYRRCANLQTPAACNWLINANEPVGKIYCVACSLNRTIPDLTDAAHPENKVYWGRVELAKRRMLAGLIGLGLGIVSKSEDSENGLAFDLVNPLPGESTVMTGHDSGLITLNLQEADDATRESVRTAMGEPYRTLLGHFRHETGHYFWDRLVKNSDWISDFRHLFGDESQDYATSIQANYASGPPKNWGLNYVSSYASSHPWEDWAETWAHYLHMCDTLDTAQSFGLTVNPQLLDFTPFSASALFDGSNDAAAREFLNFLNEWAGLTVLLNEMNRSMGQPDFYPFVLPATVVTKLHFVHLVIQSSQPAVPT